AAGGALDGKMAACGPLCFPERLKGGKLRKHRVGHVLLCSSRDPNALFDMSGTIDKKIDALSADVSQVGGRRGFAGRMRWWAKNTGSAWDLGAAEAFRYIELG